MLNETRIILIAKPLSYKNVLTVYFLESLHPFYYPVFIIPYFLNLRELNVLLLMSISCISPLLLNDQVDNNLFNHKRDNTNSKSNCIFSSLFSDGYNTVVGLFFTFLVLNKSSDVVERVALNQSERPCQLILVIQVCRRYSP